MIRVGLNNEKNRIEWISHILKTIPSGARILDAGAGEKKFKDFCKHLNYVSQDFNQYDGIGNTQGLQTHSWVQNSIDIVSDIIEIPEPNQSFDVILCTEVFEHLPEPILAISEFSRLLRKDGLLIVTAPFCSLTHFAPYHFYTGFNKYFYEAHLPRYDFEIISLEENGNYFEYLAQELRRLKSISTRYTNSKQSLLEKIAVRVILLMLKRLSEKDLNSSELLNHGYHVLAKKK